MPRKGSYGPASSRIIKSKKFVALLLQKNYFRIFRPTKTIISHGAANTSVASSPALPDVKAAPAMLPPPDTMTARMLKRLPVASAIVSLSFSRYGNHRLPELFPPNDFAASIQNTVPEMVRLSAGSPVKVRSPDRYNHRAGLALMHLCPVCKIHGNTKSSNPGTDDNCLLKIPHGNQCRYGRMGACHDAEQLYYSCDCSGSDRGTRLLQLVEETVVRPGESSPGPHAAEHAPKGILRIGILPLFVPGKIDQNTFYCPAGPRLFRYEI